MKIKYKFKQANTYTDTEVKVFRTLHHTQKAL